MRTAALLLVCLCNAPGGGFAQSASAPAPAAEPRVTVSFQHADLWQVLHRLFLETGARFEAPPDAAATITATIEDVPLERALRLLLGPHGYTFRREGELYRILPSEEFRRWGERLAAERLAEERRFWIWMSRRPPKPPLRSKVHARDASEYGVSSALSSVVLAPGGPIPQGAAGTLLQYYRPQPARRSTRSVSFGPLALPIPDWLHFLPGGGWSVGLPAEGEIRTVGPFGEMTIPVTSTGGLSIGHK